MLLVGFEPTISAGERPHTYADPQKRNNDVELARNMSGADSLSWFIVCHKIPRDGSVTFPCLSQK